MGIPLSETKAIQKPKRRWFRFRLRTMFIVMTLLAVWLGPHLHSTRLQTQSVTAVREHGGSVHYDYHYPTGRYGLNDVDYSAESPVPQWLLDWMGVDFFHDVVEVDVGRVYGRSKRNTDVDDRLLGRLRGFPELRRLELSHCGITDKGLQHLPAFALLETLDLDYSSVTDDGLPYIGRLKSLKRLYLAHTRVNGRGFHRLAGLEQLEVLNLTLTPIRDVALNRASEIEGLTYVSVHSCRYLTPDGVAAFQQAVPKCEMFGVYSLKKFWQDRQANQRPE